MNSYELMLILDPNLKPQERKEVVEKINKLLDTSNAKNIKEKLLGKKRLAYKIGDLSYGDYMQYNFEADPGSLKDLRSKLNIFNGIIRYMINKQ